MANSEVPWLKWYPSRSRNSLRWNSLTLEERGFFHELYDIAALAAQRGRITGADGGAPDADLACALSIDAAQFGRMIGSLLVKRLIKRTKSQALVFPDFAAHQRNGPLRVRRKSGAKVARVWRKSGAQDVDVEEERDKEEEGERESAPHPSSAQEAVENCIGGTIPSSEYQHFAVWVANMGESFVVEQCKLLRGTVGGWWKLKQAIEKAKNAVESSPAAAVELVRKRLNGIKIEVPK